MKEYTVSIHSNLLTVNTITPQILVLYQPFIKKIIYGFVQSSRITTFEVMDYLQLVNEKLLVKLQSNKFKNYSINTSLKGFLAVVVKNIVKNEIRAQQLRKTQSLDRVASLSCSKSNREVAAQFQWEYQSKRLEHIMRLFHQKDRSKLELCLLVMYHIPLKSNSLKKLYPLAGQEVISRAIQILELGKCMVSKAELWKRLREGLQILEGKSSQVDALRKWYAKRYKVIIHHLFNKYPKLDNSRLDVYFEYLLYHYYEV